MTARPAAPSVPATLAAALRMRTGALHARAERAGVVRAILAGEASRHGYALLLRNLLPAYQALETGLERHRATLAGLARPDVYRAGAIAADLAALSGRDWPDRLRLLPAGARYAHRVALAAEGNGARLIAHAYARTLGDLSGGQVLRRLLARTLGVGPGSLTFLEFPTISDMAAFKADYRAALDRAGSTVGNLDDVVNEAAVAFRLNIHVAEAVQSAAERVCEGA
jgi:heme oxygenase